MWHNLAQLVRYRGLIQTLVARDLKARYRGSALGFFWSFINPLLLISIYTIVFTRFLPGTADDPNRPRPFAVFMFCGVLPWTWFSSALLESAGSLIFNGNLIRKVLFPAEVLPIVSVLSTMAHFAFGLPILGAFLVYFGWFASPPGQIQLHFDEVIWLPVVIAIQLLFTTAMALLLSSLTVHFRDIKDLIGNVVTFWFFVTPIVYPWRTLPAAYLPILKLNPFYHLAVSYQEILFFKDDAFGQLRGLLILGAASIAFFFFAYWVFDRLRDSFAEAV